MKFLKKILGGGSVASQDFYKKGMHFYNRSEYDKASQYFEQAIAGTSPANSLNKQLAKFYCGRAYTNLGIENFIRHENQKALHHFRKALELSTENPDLNYFIGICQNNIGEYQKAMEAFTKMLVTAPWNIPTKLKMAVIFHNLEMWKNAEEIQRSILEKHPRFANVHFHLGLTLMGQGKIEEAELSFSRTLSINPNYIDARLDVRLKLSITQICLNKYDSALSNLETIVKRHPDYADVYYLMSIIKEKCGQTEAGRRLLEKALQISPKYKNALVKMIMFHCWLCDLEAAKKRLEQAFEIYPDDTRLSNVKQNLSVFNAQSDESSRNECNSSFNNEVPRKALRNEFYKDLDIMPNFSEIIAMFSSSRYAQEDSSISTFLIPIIAEQIKKNSTRHRI